MKTSPHRRKHRRRAFRRLFWLLVLATLLLLLWPRRVTLDGLNSPHAILLQADSGEVLAEKDADSTIYPASMTKMMTASAGHRSKPGPRHARDPARGDLSGSAGPECLAGRVSARGNGHGAGSAVRGHAALGGRVLRSAGPGGERQRGSFCGPDEPESGRAGDDQPRISATPPACTTQNMFPPCGIWPG